MEKEALVLAVIWAVFGWVLFLVSNYFYQKQSKLLRECLYGWEESNNLIDEIYDHNEKLVLMLKLMDEKEKQADNIPSTKKTMGGVQANNT